MHVNVINLKEKSLAVLLNKQTQNHIMNSTSNMKVIDNYHKELNETIFKIDLINNNLSEANYLKKLHKYIVEFNIHTIDEDNLVGILDDLSLEIMVEYCKNWEK